DATHDSLTIEVTGPTDKIESLLAMIRPYGIKEVARTGAVAMTRGANTNGLTLLRDQVA
ncbi:MAG TPA: acetolactate synthase small subunit, partial [Thermomicrobiales bacterium]|nr:acetolactate synthase small subunit [Thermomicrobiales bacterium]